MKDNELLYRSGSEIKKSYVKSKKWSLRDLEALTDIDNSLELSKYEFGFISPQLLSLYKLLVIE